jgi:hypothetical protein
MEYSHHGILHGTNLPFFLGRKMTKTTNRDFIEHAKMCTLGDKNFFRVFIAVPLPSVLWSLLLLCHLSLLLPNQFSVPVFIVLSFHSSFLNSFYQSNFGT